MASLVTMLVQRAIVEVVAILGANSVSLVVSGCARRDRCGRAAHQADIPTQEELPTQDARFSRAHGDAGRQAGAQGQAAQGPQTADTCGNQVNRRHRLRGRGRFAEVRQHGVRAHDGVIRVRAHPNHRDTPRVGFAVQGARHAVDRNRVRRRLRAILSTFVTELPAVDVVVTAPATCAAARSDMLRGSVERATRAAALQAAVR